MLDLGTLYDNSYYLAANPDVANAVSQGSISGFDHYAQFGQFENRNPNAIFDASYYLSQNQDVLTAVQQGFLPSAVQHYIQFGHLEDRDPSIFFDASFYEVAYVDVDLAVEQGVFTSVAEHFLVAGQFEGRNSFNLFDTQFYFDQNSDVEAAVGTELTAIEHFVLFGQFEGRDPIARFNTAYYLQENPDVAQAAAAGSISAVQHYVLFGRDERRLSEPSPGLSLNAPVNAGTLTTLFSVSDSVGQTNFFDLYRFNTESPNIFNLSLTGLTGDADVLLIQDLNNNRVIDDEDVLAASVEFGTDSESITINNLLVGTYFVQIAYQPFSGTPFPAEQPATVDYTLNMSLGLTPT